MGDILSESASYIDWSRTKAANLGHDYEDRTLDSSIVSLTRCQLQESYSDAPTPDLSIQLCSAGDYDLTADLGFGRFSGRRRKGSIIIGPPHQEICLSGGSHQGFEITALCLRWEEVAKIAGSVTGKELQDFGRIHATFLTDPAIEEMILRLWQTLAEDSPLARLYADGAVMAIVATLLKLAEAPAKPSPTGLAPWQARRATEILASRLNEEVSLADLAEAVGLSTYHFARAFKASMGIPPHHHQIQLRMDRAKTLLATTRLSVLDIALEVGYESSQSLARTFRKNVGVSPSQYRRELA
ncbi:MAG: helix-turn-helix transcriptional regulator [Coleofasciculaceae cyanobacterium SM2_3_26]|nr:helix-turn-helix transcriptional regulator [Coleofasciculaceae cyanobacterium SM2_3_26]